MNGTRPAQQPASIQFIPLPKVLLNTIRFNPYAFDGIWHG